MKQIIALIFIICGGIARADLETTTVLPKGVASPKLIFGTYSGLSERFNASGLLEGVADQYHIDLTGRTLALLNSEVRELVDRLNGFTSTARFGDELSLGKIDFNSSPFVTFYAPTANYGLTENLSIGLGVPMIHFVNNMQILVSGTNNAEGLARNLGATSQGISDALNQLAAKARNLSSALQSVLVSKGYKPIRSVDYSAPGDLVLSGLYRYYQDTKWRLAVRPYLQVPTGRQDDPDDLVDFATGGQPAAGVYSIHEYYLLPKVILASSIGYQANLQDYSAKRVPRDDQDILPDQDRRDTLRRHTGNSTFIELGTRYLPYRFLELSAYYDLTLKDPDWFDGDKGWNYSILSRDSGSTIHEIKALLEFSTVSWYMRKAFSVPLQLGYIFGNTLLAENAPLQISNEFYLRMFF